MKKKNTIAAIGIPDGWTLEASDVPGYMILRAPTGYATLDLNKRGFRLGMCFSGRMHSTTIFRGRDWQQHLLDEAIASLKAIL